MGCDFSFGDDYERCQILIDEYEYLLELESNMKVNEKNIDKHNQTKDDVKNKIRNLLEKINLLKFISNVLIL